MPITPLGIPTPADTVKISQLAKTQRDGFNRVDEILQGEITPGLAQAINDAAVNAVDTEVSQLDFVQGEDTRILRNVSSPNYAVTVTDGDGYVAGGWLTDGSHNFEKSPRVMGSVGVTAQPVIAPGWAYVHTDQDGYVSFGVRDDGTFVAPKGQFDATSVANTALGLTKCRKDQLATIGDSLTEGYFDGTTQPEFSWPAHVATLAPDVEVINLAQSGWVVDEVSIKLGALDLPLTVSGGTIPASGAVTVTCPTPVGWHPNGTSRSFTGTLAGVQGVLKHTTDTDTYDFTRSTNGDPVTVEPGTIFIPESQVYDLSTMVTMIGINNVAFGVSGPEGDIVQHVVNGIRRIYNWAHAQLKQFMVMSVTTRTTWTQETGQYATVMAINERLHQEYTTRYFDLRRYLVDQAIYDLGITPTEEDLTCMSGDTLPPSIMGDGDPTHYSKDTAVLVGDQVYNWLTARDWIN